MSRISSADSARQEVSTERLTFLMGQKQKFEKLRDDAVTEENESERGLCTQLMLLTTVLITANLAIIGSTGLGNYLTGNQKLLMAGSFLLLALSALSGIRFYYVLVAFFHEWAKAKHDVVLLFGSDQVFAMPPQDLSEEVDRLQSLDIEANRLWLRLQIGLLAGALTAYVLFLLAVLFDWSRLLPQLVS